VKVAEELATEGGCFAFGSAREDVSAFEVHWDFSGASPLRALGGSSSFSLG
jgi:hypothetical protein